MSNVRRSSKKPRPRTGGKVKESPFLESMEETKTTLEKIAFAKAGDTPFGHLALSKKPLTMKQMHE